MKLFQEGETEKAMTRERQAKREYDEHFEVVSCRLSRLCRPSSGFPNLQVSALSKNNFSFLNPDH